MHTTNLENQHPNIIILNPHLHQQLIQLPLILSLRPELRQRSIAFSFRGKCNTAGAGWGKQAGAGAGVAPAAAAAAAARAT
jgi:hypothetical protein